MAEKIIPTEKDLLKATSSANKSPRPAESENGHETTADFNEENEFIKMRVDSHEDQFASDDTDSVKLIISKKELDKLHHRAGDHGVSSQPSNESDNEDNRSRTSKYEKSPCKKRQ